MFYDMLCALECDNENPEGDSPSRPGRQAAVFSSLLWPTAPWMIWIDMTPVPCYL